MLVLSRKTQQQIQIGPHVTITILKVKGETVRIGIEAPQDVCVLRSEVAQKLVGETTVNSETDATVRSALAANERERARSARTGFGKSPVARRASRIDFSSALSVGHGSLASHLTARSQVTTSQARPLGTLAGGPNVGGSLCATAPALRTEPLQFGGTLEMSAR